MPARQQQHSTDEAGVRDHPFPDRGGQPGDRKPVRIVGLSLVRNEDRFVRQALLNVADFCDRLLVVDHLSTDGTPAVLRELSLELDHLHVARISHSAESHTLVENLAGSETWILSVDGDELYDPTRLGTFRRSLEDGEFDDVFRIRPAGLHCTSLDDPRRRASGYLSPPGRPLLGIFNFRAIDSWSNVRSQRLHGGDVVFRRGFDWDSWRHLGDEPGWDGSPFRVLHVCFLTRSSRERARASGEGRPNLSETWRYRGGTSGLLEAWARRLAGRSTEHRGPHSGWKAERYRRGEHVSVDASPFFSQRAPE